MNRQPGYPVEQDPWLSVPWLPMVWRACYSFTHVYFLAIQKTGMDSRQLVKEHTYTLII